MSIFSKDKTDYKVLYQESVLKMNGLIQDMSNKLYNAKFNPMKTVPFKAKAYTDMLSAKDRMMCVSRYEWRLPIDLRSQQLEAMLYEFHSLVMFEDWDRDGVLTFSRFSRQGSLNPYGQLDKIQPIDFSGHAYGPVLSVINSKNASPKPGERVGVIVYDYTPWLPGDAAMPRAKLNLDTTINDQVNVYEQMINNIYLSVKKALALCDSDEQKNVVMEQATRMFDPSTPIVAISSNSKIGGVNQPVQMFNFANNFDTQNYCQTIEYYDKVRRGFDGIPAPDAFEKKERMITSEAENNGVDTDVVLQDGLRNRKDAIELFKKYATRPENKDISVEISDVLKPKKEEIPDDNNTDVQDERDIR